MAEDLSTQLGGEATQSGNTGVVGPAPAGLPMPSISFWSKTKERIGAAQSAIASPVQALGRSAAAKMGASEETASAVGAGLLPVVLLLIIGGIIVAVIRRGSHKQVTL